MTTMNTELREQISQYAIWLGWTVYEVSSRPATNARDINVLRIVDGYINTRYSFKPGDDGAVIKLALGDVCLSCQSMATGAWYVRDAKKLQGRLIGKDAALARVDKMIAHARKHKQDDLADHFEQKRAEMEGANRALFAG